MTEPSKTQAMLADRVGPSTVDDVRAIRQQLDQQSGHDIHILAENARRAAAEFRHLQLNGNSAE